MRAIESEGTFPEDGGTGTGRSPRVRDEGPDQWHRTRDTGGEGRFEEKGVVRLGDVGAALEIHVIVLCTNVAV